MRVTDDDYKTIIEFCKDEKLTRDVMERLHTDMPFITQLLGRMTKQGFLTCERMPFKGQYKNKYKTTPNAPKLLIERIKETEAKELRRLEREDPKEKPKPVQTERKYTVEEATKVIATGHIRVNGFSGFHGGDGKRARPKVHVGSTAEMI